MSDTQWINKWQISYNNSNKIFDPEFHCFRGLVEGHFIPIYCLAFLWHVGLRLRIGIQTEVSRNTYRKHTLLVFWNLSHLQIWPSYLLSRVKKNMYWINQIGWYMHFLFFKCVFSLPTSLLASTSQVSQEITWLSCPWVLECIDAVEWWPDPLFLVNPSLIWLPESLATKSWILWKPAMSRSFSWKTVGACILLPVWNWPDLPAFCWDYSKNYASTRDSEGAGEMAVTNAAA